MYKLEFESHNVLQILICSISTEQKNKEKTLYPHPKPSLRETNLGVISYS